MPVFGGAAVAGGNIRKSHLYVGENRFYYPPPLRKYIQVQEHDVEEEQSSTLSNGSSSDFSVSSSGTTCHVSNLFRFLEHTTPHVPAQYFPMDLWESFKEWSAYGAGVPLVLDGSECVTQYYNVSLSAIQLYVHPSKSFPGIRRPNSESARETTSHSSSGHCQRGAKSVQGNWNQRNSPYARNCEPLTGSSSDETVSCNPPGQLIFEYFEHEVPYNREPLADKISELARQCPELKTYRSCDLSPASWVALAWYPIYRIPTGPTLDSLNACFLTFHSLSTAWQSPNNDGIHFHSSRGGNLSSKLSLPIFRLAFQKLKASVWDPDGVSEGQKANSLLRAADDWIRLLQVNHPDYNYFMSHYPYWR